ncbi:UNVERIFIED_ORG: hypothetical protein EDF86_0382 [Pseudomonas psychrophila]
MTRPFFVVFMGNGQGETPDITWPIVNPLMDP